MLYNESHYTTLQNLLTTRGLSILLHGVISLPDVALCDDDNDLDSDYLKTIFLH